MLVNANFPASPAPPANARRLPATRGGRNDAAHQHFHFAGHRPFASVMICAGAITTSTTSVKPATRDVAAKARRVIICELSLISVILPWRQIRDNCAIRPMWLLHGRHAVSTGEAVSRSITGASQCEGPRFGKRPASRRQGKHRVAVEGRVPGRIARAKPSAAMITESASTRCARDRHQFYATTASLAPHAGREGFGMSGGSAGSSGLKPGGSAAPPNSSSCSKGKAQNTFVPGMIEPEFD